MLLSNKDYGRSPAPSLIPETNETKRYVQILYRSRFAPDLLGNLYSTLASPHRKLPPPTSSWMRISELSRRVGVGTETLRAWERRYGVLRPRRTNGNTRLYSALDEARIRLMKSYIAEHVPVAQAAEMAMSAQLRLRPGSTGQLPEHERRSAVQELASALAVFDESSADRTLQQLLGAYAVTTVLRDVIVPYLHEVGEAWEQNRMSVAQEHFASHFLQSRLHALSRGWDRGLGPRAVLAAAPGDYHTLGITCFGIALHRLGWRVVCLGAATPIEMISEVVATTGASLIGLSASIAGVLEPHSAALAEIAQTTPVAIGGHAATPELARRCQATYLDDLIAGATKVTLMGSG
jgi:MerR family transcriptional regulator, light-induced transcriptional regulator